MKTEEDALESLLARMRELGADARARIEAAPDAAALEDLRIAFLGKKSELSNLMRAMGSLTPEQRPLAGKVANEVKDALAEALGRKQKAFARAERARRLSEEKIDVTLPGRPAPLGHLHPITLATREIVAIFAELGFEVVAGPDLEDEYHNFEALNIPANHPARDMQDTFYLAGGGVLRTHTSPVQIRVMEIQKPPIRSIMPGRVYRNEEISARHHCLFHQVEGLYVDEGVSLADLKGTLLGFARRCFGAETTVRIRPSFFPFTEPSVEVDVRCFACGGRGCSLCKGTTWLEIGGAGMVHPNVLKSGRIDPEKYTGFAFGMGVERTAMLKYRIDDLRLFTENDVRFLRQF
jgi:phenylalanyl-tRNA synthetase alpha chain